MVASDGMPPGIDFPALTGQGQSTRLAGVLTELLRTAQYRAFPACGDTVFTHRHARAGGEIYRRRLKETDALPVLLPDSNPPAGGDHRHLPLPAGTG